MNTSAGAPDSTCFASAELAANEKRMGMPVFAVYALPTSSRTLVSDEAPNTVRVFSAAWETIAMAPSSSPANRGLVFTFSPKEGRLKPV